MYKGDFIGIEAESSWSQGNHPGLPREEGIWWGQWSRGDPAGR